MMHKNGVQSIWEVIEIGKLAGNLGLRILDFLIDSYKKVSMSV